MNWLKKGAWTRLIAGFAVLWLAIHFLFDPALKFGLIKAGQAAAGAKVEIASVRSKWPRGTLEIRGIAVADRGEPMKNVVELTRAGFHLDIGAALRGKAVIREAALEGLRFGTPRKTSGALPKPPPPSKIDLAIREKVAPVGQAALGKATQVESNAHAQVDATKLQGLKKLDEAKAKAAEIEERWKGKSAETQAIAKEAQEVADELKTLGGGDILQKAARAGAAQKKLKDLITRVDAQREQAKKDLAEARDALKQADELRRKDLNGLLAQAGLPTLDTQDIARRLLGAQTAGRLSTAMHWLRWARERAAARKAAASSTPPPPARRRGVDVEFPRAHSYPQFLLENAKLSGSLEKVFMGEDMALAGILDGVTSNPALYGKPATLQLSGAASGGTTLKVAGRLDQQDNPVGIGVRFEATGLSLAGTSLGDGTVGGSIVDGRAKILGDLRCVGDEWKGDILIEASGVRLKPAVNLPGAAAGLVSEALGSLNAFQARIAISGKEDDLRLSFSSNIGDVVASAMKKALAGQFEAQRKTLEAQVNALYEGKLKDARGQTDALSGKILGPLDAQRAGLDRQLQDALKKALGGNALPDLRKLFK